MPDSCVICKRLPSKELNITLHHFPPKSKISRRKQWLKILGLSEDDITAHHKVCSRHFPNRDSTQIPSLNLGRKFQSPKKLFTSRAERAAKRSAQAAYTSKQQLCVTPNVSPQMTPMETDTDVGSDTSLRMSTPIGEQLLSTSDYSLYELPDLNEGSSDSVMGSGKSSTQDVTNVIVHSAILPQIRTLEEEKKRLITQLQSKKQVFGIESIAGNDSLVQFYTGFKSYEQLLAFYEFLGPVVNHLRYWGTEENATRKRKLKLNPLNQLFLVLVKLKLNLRERDIAYRFGVSTSTVSKYLITWICFLYQHLSEIDWKPSPELNR